MSVAIIDRFQAVLLVVAVSLSSGAIIIGDPVRESLPDEVVGILVLGLSSESPVSVHFVVEGVLDFESATVGIGEVDLPDVVGVAASRPKWLFSQCGSNLTFRLMKGRLQKKTSLIKRALAFLL